MDNASHALLAKGHLVAVRWYRSMSAADAELILRTVRERREALGAERLFYIGIQDSKTMGMSQEESKLATTVAKEVLALVDGLVLVVEGDGLGSKLLRISFRALLASAKMTGMQNVAHVHLIDDVKSALDKLGLGGTDGLEGELRAVGIIL